MFSMWVDISPINYSANMMAAFLFPLPEHVRTNSQMGPDSQPPLVAGHYQDLAL